MSGAARAYNAAEAIDDLLAPSDGKLLAAVSFYKTNVGSLFGIKGVMEIIRQQVAAAECVRFASERAGAGGRGNRILLKVDDAAAIKKYPALDRWLKQNRVKDGDLGYGGRGQVEDKKALELIVSFKNAVVHEEVCKKVVDVMNEAVRPHWDRAKGHLVELGADAELQRLMVSSIFGIGIGRDFSVHSRDKIVILSTLV